MDLFIKKAPEADACPWRSGIRCSDEKPDCARCGWFPAEEKRRKLERLASGRITIKRR